VYHQKIWESMGVGAGTGMAAAAVIYKWRQYNAEKFIKGSSYKFDNEEDTDYVKDRIRDMAQTEVGARQISSFLSSGNFGDFEDIKYSPPTGTRGIGVTDWGVDGKTPSNRVYFDVQELRLHEDAPAIVSHEFGHTKSGGTAFSADIKDELRNEQSTNNPVRWWMGLSPCKNFAVVENPDRAGIEPVIIQPYIVPLSPFKAVFAPGL
jgi:hypothetical protein